MKADYTPGVYDQLFMTLLPLPPNIQLCPVEVFVEFQSDIAIGLIQLLTSCPQLSIEGFLFPSESAIHHVNISENPASSNSKFDTNGALITVESFLTHDYILLNPYIKVLSPDDGPAMYAAVWSNGTQRGLVPKAAFSIFNAYFTSSITIADNFATFKTDAVLFNEKLFKVHLQGAISSDSSWDENFKMHVTGKFDDGPSSFVDVLESYIYNYTYSKIALSKERVNNTKHMVEELENKIQAVNTQKAEILTLLSTAESDSVNAMNWCICSSSSK